MSNFKLVKFQTTDLFNSQARATHSHINLVLVVFGVRLILQDYTLWNRGERISMKHEFHHMFVPDCKVVLNKTTKHGYIASHNPLHPITLWVLRGFTPHRIYNSTTSFEAHCQKADTCKHPKYRTIHSTQ